MYWRANVLDPTHFHPTFTEISDDGPPMVNMPKVFTVVIRLYLALPEWMVKKSPGARFDDELLFRHGDYMFEVKWTDDKTEGYHQQTIRAEREPIRMTRDWMRVVGIYTDWGRIEVRMFVGDIKCLIWTGVNESPYEMQSSRY